MTSADDERASNFGWWVMFAIVSLYMVPGMLAFYFLEPTLGSELVIGLILFGGVFAIHLGQKLGDRAKWLYAARRGNK